MGPDDAAGADRALAGLHAAFLAEAREAEHRKATAELLKALVGVVDALRALEGRDAVPGRALRAVAGQALAALARAGVEPMDPVGRPLDLARAEVVGVRADPAAAPDTVIEEHAPGYLWNGAVLRPARVVVAGPAPAAPDSPEG